MPIADRAKKSTPITAAKGGNMFTQTVDPIGNLGLTCLVALIPVVLPARAPRGLPRLRLARRAARLDRHLRARRLGLAHAARHRNPRLFLRLGDRRLERRLDHLLGPDAVQHARPHRPVREPAALADLAGHARHPRADDAVRLGVRRLARGPGRLRLSLGRGGADPDFARAEGPRRHPGRRHRQQRAGVLRSARRADHRDGRGHRLSVAGAVRLGRHASSPSWRCCRPGC